MKNTAVKTKSNIENLPSLREEEAVVVALTAVGFRYNRNSYSYYIEDQDGFIMIALPKENTKTFTEVINLIGSMTFSHYNITQERKECARLNFRLIEFYNHFQDQQ